MMIKLVFSCCALAIALALPLDAFALQGENIAFESLESIIFGTPGTLIRGSLFGDSDGPEDFGDSEANLALNFQDGTSSRTILGSAKIISPINVPVFIPNHCVSLSQGGSIDIGPEDTADVRLRAGALSWSAYATSPGLANPPSDTNEYATMEVVFHFLGVGMDCSNLMFDVRNFLFPEGHFSPSTRGFEQGILVGDTNVVVTHMGDGVFVTTGQHAASTEKSLANYTTATFLVSDCGVNHLWVARQRVPIDSDGVGVIDVFIAAQLDTRCVRDGRNPGRNRGANPWSWSSTASAYFFARDYCTDDISVRFDQAGNPVDASGDPISFDEDGNPVDTNGDPVIGADGIPIGPNGGGVSDGSLFCNPIKVLINNTLDLAEGEEEATLTESSPGVTLGIAGLNEIPVAAFRDLETVVVQVAPGPVFRCNLIINDAATGQPVASFDPSDAAYDAATGMAVFDLSSEGPFAPGMYDVRVGTLYRAEVYVAIPGDVNLDGTVDTVDRQIIEDNIEAGATTTGVWTTGDVNNDGVVDELDLEIVDGQLPLLGDINGDGAVTFGDIGPLLDIIFGAPTQVEADINGDGVVSFGDLGPLLDLLFSQ